MRIRFSEIFMSASTLRLTWKCVVLLVSVVLLFALKKLTADNWSATIYSVADPAWDLSNSPPRPCRHLPLKFSVNESFFPCNWRSAAPPDCNQRLRARISCNDTAVDIVYERANVSAPPAAYSFTDECLARVVREKCSGDKHLIPKLVHFVTFGGKEMPFYTFLGVLSTVRFVQPCMLLFHADSLPTGQFWETLLRLVPNIVHVSRLAPAVIFGNKVDVVEHKSDIARLEAVKTFGGLYVDTDYLLLNPVDDLRQYTVVMGNTIPDYNYCNCVFMGKAGAEFFTLWYDSYHTFNDKDWGFHSTIMPYNLHKKHPNVSFHVVDTFVRPWFKDIKEKFYDSDEFDWTIRHGIHLYVRFNKEYFVGNFETKNSSLGRVSRRILFGDHHRCFANDDIS